MNLLVALPSVEVLVSPRNPLWLSTGGSWALRSSQPPGGSQGGGGVTGGGVGEAKEPVEANNRPLTGVAPFTAAAGKRGGGRRWWRLPRPGNAVQIRRKVERRRLITNEYVLINCSIS